MDEQTNRDAPTGIGILQGNAPTIAGNVKEPLDILIVKVTNGYLVNVGCRRVVFETTEKMLSELERYLKNPRQVEKEYLEKYA